MIRGQSRKLIFSKFFNNRTTVVTEFEDCVFSRFSVNHSTILLLLVLFLIASISRLMIMLNSFLIKWFEKKKKIFVSVSRNTFSLAG